MPRISAAPLGQAIPIRSSLLLVGAESSLPAQSLMELPERLDDRLRGQYRGVEYFESHPGILGA